MAKAVFVNQAGVESRGGYQLKIDTHGPPREVDLEDASTLHTTGYRPRPLLRDGVPDDPSIKSGFRDCGICPYEPDLVLKELERRNPEEPVLEMWHGEGGPPDGNPTEQSPSPPTSQPSTPKNRRQLLHQADKLKTSFHEARDAIRAVAPNLENQLGAFIKGSLAQSELADLCKTDLERYAAAATRKSQPRSRRQVKGLSSDGAWYARDAFRQIDARQVEEAHKRQGRPMCDDVPLYTVPAGRPILGDVTNTSRHNVEELPDEELFVVDTTGSRLGNGRRGRGRGGRGSK